MHESRPLICVFINNFEWQQLAHRRLALTYNLQKYGEWAVVTGASSGIGRAIAAQIVNEGGRCVLVARRKERLLETARALGEDSCRVVSLDLCDKDAADVLLRETEGLDVGLFIHSAGIAHMGPLTEIEAQKINALIDIHIRATVLLTQRFAQSFKSKGRGGIMLVSSGLAFAPVPYVAVYSAAKSFVLSFGQSLSEEMRHFNVDVLTLVPGGTQTDMATEIESFVDFSKLKMPMAPAEGVASVALKHLGKSDSVVPGLPNKLMALMMKLMGPTLSKRLMGKMMGHALWNSPFAQARGQS